MEERVIDNTSSIGGGGKRKHLLLWSLIVVVIVIIIFGFIYSLINNGTPEPPSEKGILKITSDNLVLEENPRLINIPYNSKVKLNVELIENGKTIPQNINDVEFHISHPVSKIKNPESIISFDSEGYAYYNGEGYVFVSASLKEKGDSRLLRIDGGEVILAGGEVYGDPKTDNVIAIFPSEYKPEESEYSFGDMINNYPDFIRIWNLAYDIESDLFNGFIPNDGDKQILALLYMSDNPGHCGGNNNPLETGPCCYMNCGDGTPLYNVPINEMAHNFNMVNGFRTLLWADNHRLGDNGFYGAFLQVQYIAHEFATHPEKYGISRNSFEFKYFDDFLKVDIPENEKTLNNFEKFINEGRIDGLFDLDSLDEQTIRENRLDKISVFASFFVVPATNPNDFGNKYGWEFYRRFLNLFDNRSLENFEEDKVETYFAAAYSVAIGKDMREKLRFFGFAVDDNYFNEIYPQLSQKLND